MKTASTSFQEQRARMLERLRERPVSTIEARRDLDILHPAGRVMELRKVGHQIHTVTINEQTEHGRRHKVARYVLIPNGGMSQPEMPQIGDDEP